MPASTCRSALNQQSRSSTERALATREGVEPDASSGTLHAWRRTALLLWRTSVCMAVGPESWEL